MKKVIIIVLSLLMCMQITWAYSISDMFLGIDDTLIIFEEGEMLVANGTNYIPLRESVNVLGGVFIWDENRSTIYIHIDDREITINTMLNEYSVRTEGQWSVLEGKNKKHIVLPKIDNRTYISVRDFADMIGYRIEVIQEGPIIRLTRGANHLSNAQFYNKYEEYIKSQTKEVIYLTFDDGPNQHTEAILDLLKQYDVKATFFMLEPQMRKYPDVVRRIKDEGHQLALHGVTHDKNRFYRGDYGPLEEMNQANETLKSITGETTKITRTPYGSVPYLTAKQHSLLNQSGYSVWDWHVDSRDWANRNGKVTYNHVVSQLNNKRGQEPIVLFHDLSYTVETLELLLEWMEKENITSKVITQEMQEANFRSKTIR